DEQRSAGNLVARLHGDAPDVAAHLGVEGDRAPRRERGEVIVEVGHGLFGELLDVDRHRRHPSPLAARVAWSASCTGEPYEAEESEKAQTHQNLSICRSNRGVKAS